MSKGLGKIERAVIKFLESRNRKTSTWSIASALYFPEEYFNDRFPGDPTPAQYKSLLRALNSLERKGFLTSEKEPTRFEAPISWRKVYTLTPRTDFRAINT